MIVRRPHRDRSRIRRRSFRRALSNFPPVRLLALWLLLATLLGSIAPLHAQDPAPVAASTILEAIDFRRNGEVEQVVGEVEILGDRARLRLFSDQLATHYEIWVEIADFIGAKPLDAEANAAALAARAAKIESHKIELEAARKLRLEKRAKEEAADQARGARQTDRDRRKSRSRRGGEEESDAGRRATPTGTDELRDLAKELTNRRAAAFERTRELLDEIAPRLSVARLQKRPLRRIAGAVEDAQMALDEIESGLAGREKALGRVERDIAAGAIWGKPLAEHLGSMARRFARLEKKLQEVERELELQGRSLIALPPEPATPPVPVETGEADEDRSSARPRVRAPEPSNRTRRASSRDSAASYNARVAEASALETSQATAPAIASGEAESLRSESGTIDSDLENSPASSEASESSEEAKDVESTGRGGLPVWPLYPLAILACFLLWWGQRKPRVDEGMRRPPVVEK